MQDSDIKINPELTPLSKINKTKLHNFLTNVWIRVTANGIPYTTQLRRYHLIKLPWAQCLFEGQTHFFCSIPNIHIGTDKAANMETYETVASFLNLLFVLEIHGLNRFKIQGQEWPGIVLSLDDLKTSIDTQPIMKLDLNEMCDIGQALEHIKQFYQEKKYTEMYLWSFSYFGCPTDAFYNAVFAALASFGIKTKVESKIMLLINRTEHSISELEDKSAEKEESYMLEKLKKYFNPLLCFYFSNCMVEANKLGKNVVTIFLNFLKSIGIPLTQTDFFCQEKAIFKYYVNSQLPNPYLINQFNHNELLQRVDKSINYCEFLRNFIEGHRHSDFFHKRIEQLQKLKIYYDIGIIDIVYLEKICSKLEENLYSKVYAFLDSNFFDIDGLYTSEILELIFFWAELYFKNKQYKEAHGLYVIILNFIESPFILTRLGMIAFLEENKDNLKKCILRLINTLDNSYDHFFNAEGNDFFSLIKIAMAYYEIGHDVNTFLEFMANELGDSEEEKRCKTFFFTLKNRKINKPTLSFIVFLTSSSIFKSTSVSQEQYDIYCDFLEYLVTTPNLKDLSIDEEESIQKLSEKFIAEVPYSFKTEHTTIQMFFKSWSLKKRLLKISDIILNKLQKSNGYTNEKSVLSNLKIFLNKSDLNKVPEILTDQIEFLWLDKNLKNPPSDNILCFKLCFYLNKTIKDDSTVSSAEYYLPFFQPLLQRTSKKIGKTKEWLTIMEIDINLDLFIKISDQFANNQQLLKYALTEFCSVMSDKIIKLGTEKAWQLLFLLEGTEVEIRITENQGLKEACMALEKLPMDSKQCTYLIHLYVKLNEIDSAVNLYKKNSNLPLPEVSSVTFYWKLLSNSIDGLARKIYYQHILPYLSDPVLDKKAFYPILLNDYLESNIDLNSHQLNKLIHHFLRQESSKDSKCVLQKTLNTTLSKDQRKLLPRLKALKKECIQILNSKDHKDEACLMLSVNLNLDLVSRDQTYYIEALLAFSKLWHKSLSKTDEHSDINNCLEKLIKIPPVYLNDFITLYKSHAESLNELPVAIYLDWIKKWPQDKAYWLEEAIKRIKNLHKCENTSLELLKSQINILLEYYLESEQLDEIIKFCSEPFISDYLEDNTKESYQLSYKILKKLETTGELKKITKESKELLQELIQKGLPGWDSLVDSPNFFWKIASLFPNLFLKFSTSYKTWGIEGTLIQDIERRICEGIATYFKEENSSEHLFEWIKELTIWAQGPRMPENYIQLMNKLNENPLPIKEYRFSALRFFIQKMIETRSDAFLKDFILKLAPDVVSPAFWIMIDLDLLNYEKYLTYMPNLTKNPTEMAKLVSKLWKNDPSLALKGIIAIETQDYMSLLKHLINTKLSNTKMPIEQLKEKLLNCCVSELKKENVDKIKVKVFYYCLLLKDIRMQFEKKVKQSEIIILKELITELYEDKTFMEAENIRTEILAFFEDLQGLTYKETNLLKPKLETNHEIKNENKTLEQKEKVVAEYPTKGKKRRKKKKAKPLTNVNTHTFADNLLKEGMNLFQQAFQLDTQKNSFIMLLNNAYNKFSMVLDSTKSPVAFYYLGFICRVKSEFLDSIFFYKQALQYQETHPNDSIHFLNPTQLEEIVTCLCPKEASVSNNSTFLQPIHTNPITSNPNRFLFAQSNLDKRNEEQKDVNEPNPNKNTIKFNLNAEPFKLSNRK